MSATLSTLRLARVDAGLSIDELATRSGISPEQIRNIESGRALNPRVKTLVALAKALKVKPSDIDPMLTERSVA